MVKHYHPMKKPIFYILFLFQLIACKTDMAVAPTLVYQVPAEIEVYVDKFIEEAKIRGIDIKKENLLAEFFTVSQGDICGQCSQATNNPDKSQKKITIVKNTICWTSAKIQSRETLVFHELGHCWLGRMAHKDSFLPNGVAASIMSTRNDNPYSPCEYDITGNGDCDKTARRKYYIDELFDEKTSTPTWGK